MLAKQPLSSKASKILMLVFLSRASASNKRPPGRSTEAAPWTKSSGFSKEAHASMQRTKSKESLGNVAVGAVGDQQKYPLVN